MGVRSRTGPAPATRPRRSTSARVSSTTPNTSMGSVVRASRCRMNKAAPNRIVATGGHHAHDQRHDVDRVHRAELTDEIAQLPREGRDGQPDEHPRDQRHATGRADHRVREVRSSSLLPRRPVDRVAGRLGSARGPGRRVVSHRRRPAARAGTRRAAARTRAAKAPTIPIDSSPGSGVANTPIVAMTPLTASPTRTARPPSAPSTQPTRRLLAGPPADERDAGQVGPAEHAQQADRDRQDRQPEVDHHRVGGHVEREVDEVEHVRDAGDEGQGRDHVPPASSVRLVLVGTGGQQAPTGVDRRHRREDARRRRCRRRRAGRGTANPSGGGMTARNHSDSPGAMNCSDLDDPEQHRPDDQDPVRRPDVPVSQEEGGRAGRRRSRSALPRRSSSDMSAGSPVIDGATPRTARTVMPMTEPGEHERRRAVAPTCGEGASIGASCWPRRVTSTSACAETRHAAGCAPRCRAPGAAAATPSARRRPRGVVDRPGDRPRATPTVQVAAQDDRVRHRRRTTTWSGRGPGAGTTRSGTSPASMTSPSASSRTAYGSGRPPPGPTSTGTASCSARASAPAAWSGSTQVSAIARIVPPRAARLGERAVQARARSGRPGRRARTPSAPRDTR